MEGGGGKPNSSIPTTTSTVTPHPVMGVQGLLNSNINSNDTNGNANTILITTSSTNSSTTATSTSTPPSLSSTGGNVDAKAVSSSFTTALAQQEPSVVKSPPPAVTVAAPSLPVVSTPTLPISTGNVNNVVGVASVTTGTSTITSSAVPATTSSVPAVSVTTISTPTSVAPNKVAESPKGPTTTSSSVNITPSPSQTKPVTSSTSSSTTPVKPETGAPAAQVKTDIHTDRPKTSAAADKPANKTNTVGSPVIKSGLKVLEHPSAPSTTTTPPLTSGKVQPQQSGGSPTVKGKSTSANIKESPPNNKGKEPGQLSQSSSISTNSSTATNANNISKGVTNISSKASASAASSTTPSKETSSPRPSPGTNPVLPATNTTNTSSSTSPATSTPKSIKGGSPAQKKMDSQKESLDKVGGGKVNGLPSIPNGSLAPAKESLSTESNLTVASASSSASTVMSSSSALASTSDDNSELPIGQDVLTICSLLENSGLCGPSGESASRPGTANSTPPARPNTVERPRTASGDNMKNKTPNGTSAAAGDGEKPKTARPTTASKRTPISYRPPTGMPGSGGTTRSRPSTGTGAKSPPKSSRTPGGNAEGRKTPGNTPVEPNSARSGTPSRASSARVRTNSSANGTTNATTTTTSTTSTLVKRSKSIGGSSQNENKTPGRPSSTRPTSSTSSTLFQHTASSAQKGIHSPQPPLTPKASPSPSLSRPSTRPRTARPKMGDSGATGGGEPAKPATLKDQFATFSRFGDTSSDGKQITLSNSDKWMKQAHVIDGKKITTTDTSICFKKLFKTAKRVSESDFKKYVEDLAKNKKIEPQEILDKLTNCGPPGLSTSVKAAHAGVVERLTDTSKYTGSHKERFDASGKGKGIEGRREMADSSGYVSSFKNKLDLNKDGSPSPKSGSPTPVAVSKEASPPK